MLSKGDPTHQQLVERQPDFRKAGAAAWLALKRETSVPAHSAPKVELSSGLRLIYASGFPYAKPGDLRKAMQGARIRTSAVRDIRWISRQVVQLLVDADYVVCIYSHNHQSGRDYRQVLQAWIPRSEAAEKDKLAAISSFAVKTVTTIQRSPDVKARNSSLDLCSHLLVARPSRQPLLRRPRFGFRHPILTYPHWMTVPKESLPVKKATDKEPAAPAVDPPLKWLAGVTPATQVCRRLNHLPSAPFSLQSWATRWSMSSKIDRRTTKYGARFRITVPEDRQRHIIQRLERQSKQTHWRIRQNYRHRRPGPASTNSPTSTTITADPRRTPGSGPSQRPASLHQIRFTVPGFDVIQHPATGPGRRGIALGIPSCFGGHEHGSAVGTMILAKVPNFTPECLWIVGSVYVGHSGATTNYSRREALLVFGKPLTELCHSTTIILFSFLETGTPTTAPSAHCPLVGPWSDCHAVSGSQITRLSTVHGRRHSSIDHFVCNAPATRTPYSPRVDRQTAVADHFVIRTSIRAEAQGQPPAPRAPTISRHHCLEATDRIATSNYWDVLADGAQTTLTLTRTFTN
ncbi:hypothetical protein BASA83_013727 [Batrachochytrium salamandrivorans]|nr:hypothetical protein BASA83_013727 [Batrachochytrium salamandrivorans]